MSRALARIAVVTTLVVVTVLATPAAAFAHGVGGVQPSNYETIITGMQPRVAGIDVRPVDLGDRLELTNHTDRDVVVLGYEEEPYLRVGPDGAFENRRSPTTYVNRTISGSAPIPDRADSDAAPVWRKIGDEPIARWYDHRSHWMAGKDAPAVQADPGSPHVVQRFRVQLEQGDTRIVVRGQIRWVPGSSPWLWLAFAFGLAALLVALSRTGAARGAVAGALVAVVVLEIVHLVGAWGATTAGTGTKVGASVYAAGAAIVATVALVWVLRRGVRVAAPLVLIAGLFAAIAGGLADLPELSRSQLPTTLSTGTARAAVAIALGLGVGLAVVGALRLRPESKRRPRAQPGVGESWPSTQS